MDKVIPEGYQDSFVGIIPDDWNIKRVAEVTSSHKQGFYTKTPYTGKGIRLVRITDLGNPHLAYDEMPKLEISSEDYESFKIDKGDFLFARSGAIGRYGIVFEEKQAVFASYLIRFRFNSDSLSTRYFGYVYESEIAQGQIKAISQGNANININADNIKSLQFPSPPLPEQKKIARILSSVDSKLALIDQQITTTQTLKKGLMQKLFTQGVGTQDADGRWQPHTEFQETELGMIPAEWTIKAISKVTDYVDYRGKTPPKSDTGVFLVTAKNIKKGFIDYECSKEYVPFDTYEEVMSRGLPVVGDILITTEAPLGNVAQVDNPNVAIAQRVIKYRAKSSLLPDYLKYYFLSDLFQTLLDLESTGTTVKGIKGSRLHKLPVVIPSQREQQEIARILSTVDRKLEHLQTQKTQTQQLKKGLMQKLLTGQIRVQPDPQDH